FNLDVEEPMVFQEDGAGFGQSVALVVGAPLEVVAVVQTGRLYDCVAATGLCQPI
uniref:LEUKOINTEGRIN alpha D beta 2 (Fragments) n=1 Tax=Canis lupus familiaris TaxID=9615 RepID=Q9TS65_CANLF